MRCARRRGRLTAAPMSMIIAMSVYIRRRGLGMRTVQMTLDHELVDAVDRAAKRLRTTRSGFTRDALRAALDRVRVRELESKHREGYRRKPVKKTEFVVWE